MQHGRLIGGYFVRNQFIIIEMGLIGGIVGGVAKIGASIASGIAGRKAAKKQAKIIDAQERRNQDWYDKEYNADYTQRSDAQAALGQAKELLDEKYAQAEGAAAVGGASEESLARQKASANATMGDITKGIAAQADAYKAQVRNNYEQTQQGIDAKRMGIAQQQAQNVASAAQGLANAGGQIATSIWDKKE